MYLPFRLLAQRSQPSHVLLLCPSTNIFTGLTRAIIRADITTTMVAIAGVLSKVLPILLPIVPFDSLQTWKLHESCTWASVGIIVYMILVHIAAAMVIKRPYMPIRPDTIAGLVYYVCDSKMLDLFHEGMATAGEKARVVQMRGMGSKFVYKESSGCRGLRGLGWNMRGRVRRRWSDLVLILLWVVAIWRCLDLGITC